MKKNCERKCHRLHIKMLLLAMYFIISGSSILKAQETVTYSFTRSEPYRIKYLGQVKLFDLDCGMTDPFRLGAGLSLDYFLPRALSIHAAYDFSYFGVTKDMDAKILNTDKTKIAPYSGFEAGLRLNFSDKTGKHRMKIVISSTYISYNTRLEKSVKMDFPCRKVFGLRGGIYDMNLPVKSTWVDENSDQYTNLHNLGIYAGLSSLVMINADYIRDGASYYKQFFRENYIDFLYTPIQKLDPIIGSDGKSTPASKDLYKTSPFGFRVGHMVTKMRSGAASFGFEAGMRPGIMGHGLYFATRIGISICNRTRDKKL